MGRSNIRKNRAKVVLARWSSRQAAELEQKKLEIQREKDRLEEERRQLEREKKEFFSRCRLEEERTLREKRLFEMKWKILEEELRQLADEKVKVERQRDFYKFVREQEQRASDTDAEAIVSGDMFFIGVKNRQSLKKRYKELLKIYHPDNLDGDTETLQEINREYERLKKRYQ